MPKSLPISQPFVEQGTSAVHTLRRALAEAFASVGADPAEPQEISRRFKLDKTLTWRISRVIREEDVWDAVIHIPGRPSIKALVERLESSGASAHSVAAVRAAMDRFEEFVSVHSGDRETLEIMAGAGNRPSSAKRLELFRKQGFQAASAAWGIQARVHFSCQFVTPAAEPGALDRATVSGLVDLRRLRPSVPWAVGAAQAWESELPEVNAQLESIWPDGMVAGVPIIPTFCSQPMPNLRTTVSPAGSKRFELADGPLGYTGATTIAFGWKWAQTVPAYSPNPDETGEHGMKLSTPVELMIHDLLVHKSLTFAHNPVAVTYSDLPGGPRYPLDGPEFGRMPMPEDVVSLGAMPPNMTTVEIPRYRELVEFALEQLGWPINEFHGFRHRVRYPTIPTTAILRHPLLIAEPGA